MKRNDMASTLTLSAIAPTIAWQSAPVFLIPIVIMVAAILLLLGYSKRKSAEGGKKQEDMHDESEFSHEIRLIRSGNYMQYVLEIGNALESSSDESTIDLRRKYSRVMKMARTEGDQIGIEGSEQNRIMRDVASGYLQHGGNIGISGPERKM
jgi:hypothetical protein